MMRPPASLHLSYPLSNEEDDDDAYQRACSELFVTAAGV